jgi:RNA polymerase sigma-70 factor (ECF subfamily)
MDDADAIGLLKRGDLGGLEVLVSRYQVKAVRAAFLITQDRALAEDVVQDTFLRVCRRIHRSAGTFDETRPFELYLMRSVVNGSLNVIRRRAKSTSLDGPSEPIVTLLARAASVESQVETAQMRQEILRAVASLSPRERAVIVQRYYLGMSEREMAEALDAPRGTVKWLLSTARNRLHDLLRPGGSPQ